MSSRKYPKRLIFCWRSVSSPLSSCSVEEENSCVSTSKPRSLLTSGPRSSPVAAQAPSRFLCVTQLLALMALGPRTGYCDPVLWPTSGPWRTRNERTQPVSYWAASKPSPLWGFFQDSRPGTCRQKGRRSKEVGVQKEELGKSGVEEEGLGG